MTRKTDYKIVVTAEHTHPSRPTPRSEDIEDVFRRGAGLIFGLARENGFYLTGFDVDVFEVDDQPPSQATVSAATCARMPTPGVGNATGRGLNAESYPPPTGTGLNAVSYPPTLSYKLGNRGGIMSDDIRKEVESQIAAAIATARDEGLDLPDDAERRAIASLTITPAARDGSYMASASKYMDECNAEAQRSNSIAERKADEDKS